MPVGSPTSRSPRRALHCLALLLSLAWGCAADASAPPGGPLAPAGADVDEAFGLKIPDPYRWMEGESNARFDAWLHAEGRATRAWLDALPTLSAWRSRLAGLAVATDRYSQPRIVAGRLFFLRAHAGSERALWVRNADASEHLVYDPGAEPAARIGSYSPSPDARLAAINVCRGGSEICSVELREVEDGRLRPDRIDRVWSDFNPSWAADGRAFTYTRLTAPPGGDPLLGMASYLHRLGQPVARDERLVAADGAGPLAIAAHDFPFVDFVPGSPWAWLVVRGAHIDERVCVTRARAVLDGGATWRCLAGLSAHVQGEALQGDALYLLVGGDVPNRRVLRLDLRAGHAGLVDAKPFIAEQPSVVVTRIGIASDALYMLGLRDGVGLVERVDTATGAIRNVPLPYAGDADMEVDPAVRGALVRTVGWTHPKATFRLDPARGMLDGLGLEDGAPRDYAADVVEERVDVRSADGTLVPMSFERPRQLPAGARPIALLEGYGGYGTVLTPVFDVDSLEWVRAGNVAATCHVRGGGEKGERWRLGGSGTNKQRGVEDFVACARALASMPGGARVVGDCASMGGVLCGGAYATAPDAFAAMVITAGILDPVRLLAARNGANQLAELGDPRTATGLRQLLALDPTQKLQPGPRYPPLLLMVGTADQRVAPWHSGKFAARVRALSPTTPVLIRTSDGEGHFATSLSSRAADNADKFAAVEALLDR